MHDFDEYKRQGEPEKKEKSEIWQTAIGLQQVDGLKPSQYLIDTAKQNIDGDITFDEVKTRLNSYYKTKQVKTPLDDRTEEADKVSAHIAEILSEKTFNFSPAEYIGIHRRLFTGIYKHAGKIRDYNITKDEWVLNNETVLYAGADGIYATLEYDFEQEKRFKYKGLSKQQIVEHIAHFIAYLWQIHIFGEGNTRTTAVFLIKYLRKLGFKDINNDLFAQHSWYFRNALVRANYEDLSRDIHSTDKYLIRFLSNLMLKENNILKNREMHVNYAAVKNDNIKWQADVKNVPVNVPANASVNVPVNSAEKSVLKIIAENVNITYEEIAAKIKKDRKTVQRIIKKLKEIGAIKRIGSDKTGHWEVTKDLKDI